MQKQKVTEKTLESSKLKATLEFCDQWGAETDNDLYRFRNKFQAYNNDNGSNKAAKYNYINKYSAQQSIFQFRKIQTTHLSSAKDSVSSITQKCHNFNYL